jgi:SAM-dependent methyltransferase
VGADHWQDGSGYEAYVGRWSRRVAERFVPWLEVRRGGDWIDVGCGTGVLTRTIVDIEDPASVIGIDPSPAFLTTARAAQRDSRVSFIEGSAGALPLEDQSADTVVAGLVLNFVPNARTALADMRRVARPEGVVAAYVWDYAGEMQMIRTFFDAAIELDPKAVSFDEGARFPICHPDELRAAFRDVGLDDVVVTAIDVTTVFRDFDDYWSPFLRGVGPAPAYAMSLGEADRARLRDRLDRTLPREADGAIELIARAWAARGRA